MKDLIVIGAYCPDKEREDMLNKCVDSLLPLKDDFDFLITSHTIIPEYIAKKVDFTFFDKKSISNSKCRRARVPVMFNKIILRK
jgi:hypothetical protein